MPRTPDDIQTELLVLDAQSGDQDAMRRLIERHHATLTSYAMHCAGSRELGAEAAQDAWIKIITGLHRLRDPAAFRAFAYRIVTRRCVDRVRAARRSRGQLRRGDHHTEPEEDRSDELSRLRSALRRLPVDQALTVRLFYADGFGVAEIGSILGIPPNTVKSRLASARRRLGVAIDHTAREGEHHVDSR